MATTIRLIYNHVLTEINKTQASSLLLEDFNYFINKSIYQYLNKQYNIYDISLQSTDNLLALNTNQTLPVTKLTLSSNNYGNNLTNSAYEDIYIAELPLDYYHLLNCVCNFKYTKNYKCNLAGSYFLSNATRLTADLWGLIMENYYMKPSYKHPYYYFHNVNINLSIPTNPISSSNSLGTDMNNQDYSVSGSTSDNSNFPRTIILNGASDSVSTVNKPTAQRIATPINYRLELRVGKINYIELDSVLIDYLKAPLHVELTQELIDTIEDYSLIMEFSDYVCNEITNELVHIIMENSSNPRLQTHIPISTSIASPSAQESIPQPKK